MTMAALSGSRYIEYLLRPMRDSTDVTQSDLGTEEDLEMLLNTFSGYDMEIADLSQIGANAERARTTSCSTSRTPGPSQARRCQPRCYRSKIASLGQSAFGCSARRDGQLHNSRNYRKRHGGDRGGEECRKSVRWERKGPGSAVDRLLDIFHFKITHLLVKIKFKYLCNATFVLMYYLVLHCVSSCLVLGRECNDLQVYPHLRNVRGICQTIVHHIVVFKPLCCSGCQSDLGWQLQDTGTR